MADQTSGPTEPPFVIPPELRRRVQEQGIPDECAWLERLPGIVALLADRWSLQLEPPFLPGGQTSWVAPGRRHGRRVVLKVGWAHEESEHEAEGLAFWAAEGAVEVYETHREGATRALLLERARPGTELFRSGLADTEQDVVVAGLLQRLWRRPGPGQPFRPLATMCRSWAEESAAVRAQASTGRSTSHLDRGLVGAGLAAFRSLAEPAADDVLLPTDLHPMNVLAAQREPWLLIDPKPYVGDRHYDPLQHMLNFPERLVRDPHGFVRRMAGLCDLDAARLEEWLFARAVVESAWWPDVSEVARRLAP